MRETRENFCKHTTKVLRALFPIVLKSILTAIIICNAAIFSASALTVTYNLNGGVLPTGETEYSIEAGQTSIVLENPTKTGFVFGGWCKSTDYNNYGICSSPKCIENGNVTWTVPCAGEVISEDTEYIALWKCPDVPLASSSDDYMMSNGYKDYGAMDPDKYRFTYDFDNDGIVTTNDCMTMVVKAEHPEYLDTAPNDANVIGVGFCRYNGTSYNDCANPVGLCGLGYSGARIPQGGAAAFASYLSRVAAHQTYTLRFNKPANSLHTGRFCTGCSAEQTSAISLSNGWYEVGRMAYDFDNNGATIDECVVIAVQADNPQALQSGNYANAQMNRFALCLYDASTGTYNNSCSEAVLTCNIGNSDIYKILQFGGDSAAYDDHEASYELYDLLGRLLVGNNNATMNDVVFGNSSTAIPDAGVCPFTCASEVELTVVDAPMCLIPGLPGTGTSGLVARRGNNTYHIALSTTATPVHTNSVHQLIFKTYDAQDPTQITTYYAHDASVE